MLSVDKFTIVQNALVMTGHGLIASADDAPNEWSVASLAFDRAISTLTTRHNWNFATRTALLESVLTANPSPRFARAFEKPADCLQVIALYAPLLVDLSTSDAVTLNTETGYATTDYEIVEGKICTSRADPLTLKYLALPEPEATHPIFVEVMTLYVEAGCLKGLNQDFSAALMREKQAEMMLAEGRSRTDMETPRRSFRVSALLQSRRRRRG